MEFGIEKYTKLIIVEKRNSRRNRISKSGKPENAWRERKLTSTLEYWRRTPSNERRWRGKIKKEYLRRTKKLLETKFFSRNLIKGINTRKVSLVRYSEPFLKWTREEHRQTEQRLRRLIMHKALHPRHDRDILYMSRKSEEEDLRTLKIA